MEESENHVSFVAAIRQNAAGMKVVAPRILRAIGTIMIVASCLAAFFYFYWFAPWRHLNTYSWYKAHSMNERWEEVQKQIRRTGMDHDASLDVGYFGGKSWTEWILCAYCKDSDWKSGCCGENPWHLPDALWKMTNHRVTNGPAGWREWWESNKTKTQTDWVREGFAKQGVLLNENLTTNNIIALLKLCSAKNSFKYNTYRWLRDSGWKPSILLIDHLSEQDKASVTKELFGYAEWYGEYRDAPGRLPIKEPPGRIEPVFAYPAFTMGIGVVLVGMFLSGVWLIRRRRIEACR